MMTQASKMLKDLEEPKRIKTVEALNVTNVIKHTWVIQLSILILNWSIQRETKENLFYLHLMVEEEDDLERIPQVRLIPQRMNFSAIQKEQEPLIHFLTLS